MCIYCLHILWRSADWYAAAAEEVGTEGEVAAVAATSANGTWDKLTWSLENGVLTISGSGDMQNTSSSQAV